jgi:hypothetical protein
LGIITIVLLSACDNSDTFTASPLDANLFQWTPSEAPTAQSAAPVRRVRSAQTCGRALSGFNDPGAVTLSEDRLYVGNTGGGNAKLVTVIDISIPGSEVVIDEISTPVNPVDLAVTNGNLYVIDQNRDMLHYQSLGGLTWNTVALPNATTSEWDYGNILFAHDDSLYVIHTWENLISVVDLTTHTVTDTISDLDHLPDRIVFTPDGMLVLGVGLDAPSCSANGPNLSLFDLNTHAKIYRTDLSGFECTSTLTVARDRVYVVFNDAIRVYDLATGAYLHTGAGPGLGRNITHNGARLLGQSHDGALMGINYQVSQFRQCNLLQNAQIWFPPVEEIVALPAQDGRVFMTNRNDDTLSIVDLP